MQHAHVFPRPAPVTTPADLSTLLQPTPQQRYLIAALANARAALALAIGLAAGPPEDLHGAPARWLDDLHTTLFTLDHMCARQQLPVVPANPATISPVLCHPSARLPGAVTQLRLSCGTLRHAVAMMQQMADHHSAACFTVVLHLLGNTACNYQMLLGLHTCCSHETSGEDAPEYSGGLAA